MNVTELGMLVKVHDDITEGWRPADQAFRELLCKAVRERVQFCGCEPEEDEPVERQVIGYLYNGPNGPVMLDPADVEIVYPDA